MSFLKALSAIRLTVTGARGPVGIDLDGDVTAGNFLVKAPGGSRKFIGASGTGSDAGLRTDLADTGGSGNVGYRYSVTARSRSVSDRLNDQVNVADWVVGDGTTDDTAGMQALAAYVNSLPRGAALHWGKCQVKISGNVAFSNNVSIFGHGPTISQLITTNGAQMSIAGTSADDQAGNQVCIENFRVLARGNFPAVTPLLISNTSASDQTGLSVALRSFEALCDDSSAMKYGLELDAMSQISLDHCRFLGGRGQYPLPGLGGVYIHTPSGYDRADLQIKRCQFYFLRTGIVIDGHFEGVGLSDSYFIACMVGVQRYADSDQEEPSFWIYSCHFNCEGIGIDLKRIIQASITNCLFYFQAAEDSTTVSRGIRLEYENGQFATSNIAANQFFCSNINRVIICVDVYGDPVATAVTDIIFDANSFLDITGQTSYGRIGIQLDANTKGALVGLTNTYRGMVNAPVNNQGQNIVFLSGQNGNIGFGTTNPQYPLHVAGAVKTGSFFVQGDNTCDFSGSGSPEGALTAPPGSRYWRSGQTSGSRLYYKNSGTGNTGWVAVL